MGKFIFVTGGVLSGLGKGVTAASLGAVLKARGFRVFIQKFDQYINVDAGTLNPHEHGECFVTDDGAETDLDLGHYERFIDENLTQDSSVMTGRIYADVIAKERAGEFLGQTVQVIPHLTNEIKKRLFDSQKKFKADISIVEIGGTIGDFEGTHFLEAARQMRRDAGEGNVLYCHVAFMPYLETSKELKTKPVQNSVRDLRDLGIIPDIIAVRADHQIGKDHLSKIALFAGIEDDAVIPMPTINSVYKVPLLLEDYKVAQILTKKLKLPKRKADMTKWIDLRNKIDSEKPEINIGLVGKYMGMADTYLSVTEGLKAAGWFHNVKVNTHWIDSEQIEKEGVSLFSNISGILIPGGFGSRGIEGKIIAAKYAREYKKPYLGLCLGMQIASIEFARYALNTNDVNSEEFNLKTKNPVIHLMQHQRDIHTKGGTMRLGAFPCLLAKNSNSYKAYKELIISERHRHRFEFNNKYREVLEQKGMIFAGTSPDNKLVEIVEIKDHPWFVGVQFHPEFKSRPYRPHPLFRDFIQACIKTSTLL